MSKSWKIITNILIWPKILNFCFCLNFTSKCWRKSNQTFIFPVNWMWSFSNFKFIWQLYVKILRLKVEIITNIAIWRKNFDDLFSINFRQMTWSFIKQFGGFDYFWRVYVKIQNHNITFWRFFFFRKITSIFGNNFNSVS